MVETVFEVPVVQIVSVIQTIFEVPVVQIVLVIVIIVVVALPPIIPKNCDDGKIVFCGVDEEDDAKGQTDE